MISVLLDICCFFFHFIVLLFYISTAWLSVSSASKDAMLAKWNIIKYSAKKPNISFSKCWKKVLFRSQSKKKVNNSFCFCVWWWCFKIVITACFCSMLLWLNIFYVSLFSYSKSPSRAAQENLRRLKLFSVKPWEALISSTLREFRTKVFGRPFSCTYRHPVNIHASAAC